MTEHANTVSRRVFLSGIIACGTATLLLPKTLWADEVDEKQAEADKALGELEDMQQQLDRASNNYYRALEAQAKAESQMADAQVRIEEETVAIQECQQELATRARGMYRSGGNSFLDVLVGSATFEEFATNWSILNIMNENDAALVRRSKESRQAISNAKAAYAIQRETAAHEADQARQVQESALDTITSMQAVYNSLSAEASALVAQRQAEQATVTDPETIAQLVEQGTQAVAEGNWMPAPMNLPATSETQTTAPAPTPAPAPAAEAETTPAPAAEPEPAPAPAAEPEPEPEPAPAPAPAPEPAPEPEPVWVPEPEPEPAPAPTSGELGNRVVSVALQYLGYDYVWGGKSPADGGFDCSGFVSYCYAMAGSYAPSYTGGLLYWGSPVSSPQPGDVCVIHQATGAQHAGIYYGGGQMIHAATFGVGVIIGAVQAGMQYRRA